MVGTAFGDRARRGAAPRRRDPRLPVQPDDPVVRGCGMLGVISAITPTEAAVVSTCWRQSPRSELRRGATGARARVTRSCPSRSGANRTWNSARTGTTPGFLRWVRATVGQSARWGEEEPTWPTVRSTPSIV